LPSSEPVRPSGRARRPRSTTVLSLVGGLVGLAFAVALFLRFGPDAGASSQLRGFEVLSDAQVRVDVEVAREPGTEAFCVVRARGADGTEVGRADVPVPVTQQRTAVLTPVLQTSARAVTGELVGCREGRPRSQP
jgi:Domain of unknown function (DUF4307)